MIHVFIYWFMKVFYLLFVLLQFSFNFKLVFLIIIITIFFTLFSFTAIVQNFIVIQYFRFIFWMYYQDSLYFKQYLQDYYQYLNLGFESYF